MRGRGEGGGGGGGTNARRMASTGARDGGGAQAAGGAAEGGGRHAGERKETKISLRQNVICCVFASAVRTGLDRIVAISFLMTAAEPKVAFGAKVAEVAGRGADGAVVAERTARVRVLKRKDLPAASVRCCQSEVLDEVGEEGGFDMIGRDVR